MQTTTTAFTQHLSDWINPCYIELFHGKKLRSTFLRLHPFKHTVLENLFRTNVLTNIVTYCRHIPLTPNANPDLAQEASWMRGPFGNEPFLRFLYSGVFRIFLNSLFDEDLQMRASVAPQYNHFLAGSRGIPIHNDYEQDIDVVMLLQLSQNYPAGGGGELCFYKYHANKKFAELRRIPPLQNTMTLFKVAKNSYHGVNDMHGSWERKVITFGWFTPSGHRDI